MGLVRELYGVPIGSVRDSMGFVRDLQRVPIRFVMDSHGVGKGFVWGSYGICMGFPLDL